LQYGTQKGNWFLFAATNPLITFSYYLITIHSDNFITGFDFNPAGDSIGAIDRSGMCLISDVNTNNYVFHLLLGFPGGRSTV
jgi:hypothetical protein